MSAPVNNNNNFVPIGEQMISRDLSSVPPYKEQLEITSTNTDTKRVNIHQLDTLETAKRKEPREVTNDEMSKGSINPAKNVAHDINVNLLAHDNVLQNEADQNAINKIGVQDTIERK